MPLEDIHVHVPTYNSASASTLLDPRTQLLLNPNQMNAANIYLLNLLKDHSQSSKSSLKSPPGPRIAQEPPNNASVTLQAFWSSNFRKTGRNLARNNTKFQDKRSILATTETLQRVTFHEQTA